MGSRTLVFITFLGSLAVSLAVAGCGDCGLPLPVLETTRVQVYVSAAGSKETVKPVPASEDGKPLPTGETVAVVVSIGYLDCHGIGGWDPKKVSPHASVHVISKQGQFASHPPQITEGGLYGFVLPFGYEPYYWVAVFADSHWPATASTGSLYEKLHRSTYSGAPAETSVPPKLIYDRQAQFVMSPKTDPFDDAIASDCSMQDGKPFLYPVQRVAVLNEVISAVERDLWLDDHQRLCVYQGLAALLNAVMLTPAYKEADYGPVLQKLKQRVGGLSKKSSRR